jgi:hypothetical protein
MGDWTKYKVEDMIGESFNKWLVLSFSHKNTAGNWFYTCRCKCGTESTVSATNLRTGGSKQCKLCAGKQNGKKGVYAQNVGSSLYVIRCESYYKIGTTKNIEERVRTIKAGNPFQLEVVYYGIDKGETEEYWHQYFKDKHHSGEWYCLNKEDVEIIKAGGCEI